jgi:hypothetical protein
MSRMRPLGKFSREANVEGFSPGPPQNLTVAKDLCHRLPAPTSLDVIRGDKERTRDAATTLNDTIAGLAKGLPSRSVGGPTSTWRWSLHRRFSAIWMTCPAARSSVRTSQEASGLCGILAEIIFGVAATPPPRHPASNLNGPNPGLDCSLRSMTVPHDAVTAIRQLQVLPQSDEGVSFRDQHLGRHSAGAFTCDFSQGITA